MSSYKIFTISSGTVEKGAKVGTLTLKGVGTEIPAIIIGSEGRGRERGVVAVHLTSEQYAAWKESGTVTIYAAEVSTTRAGKPKLLAGQVASPGDKAICVFPTKIGFRGGNDHTGDRTGRTVEDWDGEHLEFHPFPGEILAEGTIAQGDAGRMGSGQQLVAVMPRDVVFRTSYSGRLYGDPSAHYYLFDGNDITAVTWEERELTGLWYNEEPTTTEEEAIEEDSVIVRALASALEEDGALGEGAGVFPNKKSALTAEEVLPTKEEYLKALDEEGTNEILTETVKLWLAELDLSTVRGERLVDLAVAVQYALADGGRRK